MAQPSTTPKFEVDVVKGTELTPVRKFSYSANTELGKLKKVSDLVVLYPVLKELEVSGHPKIKDSTKKLKLVNTVFETVVKFDSLKIAKTQCDASFNFWYATKEKSKPIAAEFSYVCKKDSIEENQLFKTILGLGEWVNSNSTTKTKIAYRGFCPSK